MLSLWNRIFPIGLERLTSQAFLAAVTTMWFSPPHSSHCGKFWDRGPTWLEGDRAGSGLGNWLSVIQPVGPDITRYSPAFWGQAGPVAGWLPGRRKVSQSLSWVLLLNKRKLAQRPCLYPDSIWREVFSGVTLGGSTGPLSWSGHSQTHPVSRRKA